MSTGVAAALLGYASSVAVVVAGLQAVGAGPREVSSALLALGVGLCVATVGLSAWTRIPVAVVWTTPGAALIAATGEVDGGFSAAVGAFLLVGALVAVTGLVRALPRLLGRIPPALASAVLAGVLLPFCLAPARALGDLPLEAGVLWVAWLAALRWAPRYTAPAALVALVAVVAVGGDLDLTAGGPLAVELVTPVLTLEAVTALALPLFLVTMAAQNLVGLGVLTTYGYAAPVGRLLVGTGAASAVVAPFGAPTVNLAAITGAMTAGPGAHPDPARRWVAPVASGAVYLVLGALAPVAAAVITQADARLVTAAAGLALLGTLASSAAAALADDDERLGALVVLVVTASGVTLLGLGSAPLGLLAGLLVRAAARG